MSATFSRNCDGEGTARLCPGHVLGGGASSDSDTDTGQVVRSVASNKTHIVGGVETITALGNGRTEPTACLFPNSDSDSKGGVSQTSAALSATFSTSASGDCEYSPHVSILTQAHRQQSVKMSSACLTGDALHVDMPPSQTTDSMAREYDIDIQKVPAKALNVPTRTRLSLMLNPPKVLHNDWTGLAGEMGFEYEEIENFGLDRDPMKMVFSAWTCKQDSTIEALMQMLQEINRDDVVNDIQKLVERDARRWVERRKGDMHGQPVQDPEVSGSYPNVPETPELRGITLEDHPSGPPEIFDAYVCFTYADSEFVKEMMSILEREPYKLKLCIDFRDLVPGGSYSTITAELIENRCKRMIIVLSPDFLTSEDCNFQTKFAHSIAPSARSKRLIPVMVENCKPPNILRHLTICDYTKRDLRQWFWPRLYSALTKK